MKFDKLRLTGFKSFVEPTEFAIQPGLTGVVGPNGCGKSNLVEAMRWVMGENSYKQMRASGMDDVIFAGSGSRPPATMPKSRWCSTIATRRSRGLQRFRILEITRRIEREEGSTYRVNGKEARARDVQLLFADASSGSRSPAMVRQGQIGEIIAAKPQPRRRILEEAAGIGGSALAPPRGRIAPEGAPRKTSSVSKTCCKQIGAPGRRIAPPGAPGRPLSHARRRIRRHEALIALIAFARRRTRPREAAKPVRGQSARRRRAHPLQAETARLQALAAHALPGLREAESQAGAALQRLVLAREALEGEEKRAGERKTELERRIAQLSADLARGTRPLRGFRRRD